jgi:hypothetical protein
MNGRKGFSLKQFTKFANLGCVVCHAPFLYCQLPWSCLAFDFYKSDDDLKNSSVYNS